MSAEASPENVKLEDNPFKEGSSAYGTPAFVVPASAPAPAKRRDSVKKAFVHLKGKIPDTVFVIGESVQLNEEGFVAVKDSGVVSFKENYMEAGATPQEIANAKVVFGTVFHPKSGFKVDDPKPPCGVGEYPILHEGLQRRLQHLRKELIALHKRTGDSVMTRTAVEHTQKLIAVINTIHSNMEKNPGDCVNYDPENQYLSTGLTGVDDDSIKDLYATFSYLVLQHLRPGDASAKNKQGQVLIDPTKFIQLLVANQANPEKVLNYAKDLLEGNPEDALPTEIALILGMDIDKMISDSNVKLLTHLSSEFGIGGDTIEEIIVKIKEELQNYSTRVGECGREKSISEGKIREAHDNAEELQKRIEPLEREADVLSENLRNTQIKCNESAATKDDALREITLNSAAEIARINGELRRLGEVEIPDSASLIAELKTARAEAEAAHAEAEAAQAEAEAAAGSALSGAQAAQAEAEAASESFESLQRGHSEAIGAITGEHSAKIEEHKSACKAAAEAAAAAAEGRIALAEAMIETVEAAATAAASAAAAALAAVEARAAATEAASAANAEHNAEKIARLAGELVQKNSNSRVAAADAAKDIEIAHAATATAEAARAAAVIAEAAATAAAAEEMRLREDADKDRLAAVTSAAAAATAAAASISQADARTTAAEAALTAAKGVAAGATSAKEHAEAETALANATVVAFQARMEESESMAAAARTATEAANAAAERQEVAAREATLAAAAAAATLADERQGRSDNSQRATSAATAAATAAATTLKKVTDEANAAATSAATVLNAARDEATRRVTEALKSLETERSGRAANSATASTAATAAAAVAEKLAVAELKAAKAVVDLNTAERTNALILKSKLMMELLAQRQAAVAEAATAKAVAEATALKADNLVKMKSTEEAQAAATAAHTDLERTRESSKAAIAAAGAAADAAVANSNKAIAEMKQQGDNLDAAATARLEAVNKELNAANASKALTAQQLKAAEVHSADLAARLAATEKAAADAVTAAADAASDAAAVAAAEIRKLEENAAEAGAAALAVAKAAADTAATTMQMNSGISVGEESPEAKAARLATQEPDGDDDEIPADRPRVKNMIGFIENGQKRRADALSTSREQALLRKRSQSGLSGARRWLGGGDLEPLLEKLCKKIEVIRTAYIKTVKNLLKTLKEKGYSEKRRPMTAIPKVLNEDDIEDALDAILHDIQHGALKKAINDLPAAEDTLTKMKQTTSVLNDLHSTFKTASTTLKGGAHPKPAPKSSPILQDLLSRFT